MSNKAVFSANLKKFMELNGKSRRDICQALGYSYYTFSDWVSGKKYPRMDRVEELAEYFGCKKSDLIEEQTIENSPNEMAMRHFEMIMDEDLSAIFDDMKWLDPKEKKIVKNFVHSLAETKKTEASSMASE